MSQKTIKLRRNNQIQEKTIKLIKKSINLVIVLGFLASLALPVALKAKFGSIKINTAYFNSEKISQQKEVVLKSARDIRAKIIVEPKQQPDMVLMAIVTAYTSTPDQTDDSPFIAATGKRVYDGMLAANNLPFGTKVKFPEIYGEKIFTVDDRMNSRYGLGKMDVWMDTSKQHAMKFGVKYVKAEVYYPKYILVRR